MLLFSKGFYRIVATCSAFAIFLLGSLVNAQDLLNDFSNDFSYDFAESFTDPDGFHWPNNFLYSHSEQLIEEGKLALSAEEFGMAERKFSEALQIAKVNHGLYSATQIPALELMIETQIAKGNWETADSQLEYYEWLNIQAHETNLAGYLSGLEGMRRLLLAASADTSNPRSVRYLIAAKNLNWQAINAIEIVHGENSIELTPWLYNIVLAHYYQTATTRRRGMTSYEYKSDDEKIVSGWSLRKNESMRISYSIGKDLLQRIQSIYAANPQVASETPGLLYVYLGDWELLFGNKSDALSYYNQANALFAELEIDQLSVDRFYSVPTVLPEAKLYTTFADENLVNAPLEFESWSPIYIATATPLSQDRNEFLGKPQFSAFARFSLDSISSNVRATDSAARMVIALSDLEIVSTVPDNTIVKDLVRNEINLLQFRPKFENGIPVSQERVEMEYHFSPAINPLVISQNETTQ